MPTSPVRNSAVESDAETLEEGGDPVPSPSGETRRDPAGIRNPTWEGETLALDDDDDDAEGDILHAETQVVEDWADTQVVVDYDDDELEEEEVGSERTEVLSDGGGDDEEEEEEEEEEEVAARVLEDHRCGGGGRDDGTPDCEASASAVQERGSGSARKSFSAVRAASVRASGRAAIGRTTPICPLSEKSSILLKSKLSEAQKSDIGGKPKTEDEKVVGAVNIVLLDDNTVADKLLNNEITKSGGFKCCDNVGLSHRNGNGVVRSLFQEDPHAHLDEHQKKTGSNGDDDLPQLSGYPIAGLSYIGSQEPGEMLQANAIEVVDRILYLNDLGISEDATFGKNIKVSSPSSTGVKGAQCLAKVAQKSLAGKKAIFDWNDAYEDEGGGDFFVKRKGSFFHDDENTEKSWSLPPKSSHSYQRATDKSVDHEKKEDASSPKSLPKLRRISFPGLVQQRHMSIGRGNDKFQTPEKAKQKTILKDTQKMENMDVTKNLEEDDVGMDVAAFHDVGPDTQMAAEAMEALVSAAPEEFNTVQANHTAGVSEHVMKSAYLNREYSEFDTVQKKRSSFMYGSDATLRRSKRHRTSSARLSSGTELTVGKDDKKPAKRNVSARNIANQYTRGKPVSEEKLASRDSIDKGKCVSGDSLLTGRGKTKKGGNYELSKKRTNIDSFKTRSGIRQKADKSLSSTPISYRTRHSIAKKPEKLVNLADIHIDRVFGKNVTANAVTRNLNLKSAESASDQSRDVRCSETCSLSGQHTNAEVPCQETGSLLAAVPFHPKMRRTCISREVTSASDPSLLQNNQTATMEDNFVVVKHGNDKSKRFAGDLPSKAIDMLCSSRNMLSVTGDGTKSSSYLDRLNGIHQQSQAWQLSEDVPSCDGSRVASDGQKTLKNLDSRSCHTNATSHVERIGSPTSDVSQKGKSHLSDMIHSSPLERIVEGSPICASNVPKKKMHKEACKSSVARELIRLVSSDMTRTPVLKDSQRKETSSVCVLFSRHLDGKVVNHLGKIAKRLGISIASSIADATHFITDKFVRTRNLLEAIAVGKPVVTPMWLRKCGQLSSVVGEKNYILRDLKKEKEIGFSMPVSLACSSQSPLLKGKRIFLTPNVKPDRKTVSSLIKAAGGQPVERIGRSTMNDKILDDLLFISCDDDYAACIPLLEKGAEVFSTELILNGIVIQRLEYDRHLLFLDHVKQTRSTIWLKNEGSDQFHPVAKRK